MRGRPSWCHRIGASAALTTALVAAPPAAAADNLQPPAAFAGGTALRGVVVSPDNQRIALLLPNASRRMRRAVSDFARGAPKGIASSSDANVARVARVNDKRSVYEAREPGAVIRRDHAGTFAVDADGGRPRELINWQPDNERTGTRIEERTLTYGRSIGRAVGDGSDDFFVVRMDLFDYNGSGVMPGRTWVIAPDAESLRRRWRRPLAARKDDKEMLVHPHLRGGELGDKFASKPPGKPLFGFPEKTRSVAEEVADVAPVLYAYRSFDRQWVLPDARVINQPNPELWRARGARQVFLTAPHDRAPSSAPSLTLSALIPDLHHYSGRGGRTFPSWADADGLSSSIRGPLLSHWTETLGRAPGAEDMLADIAAVGAHPGYVERFRADLGTPGLRIPLTADAALFDEAVELGRRVVWLHTFGERFADPSHGRPADAPRLAPERRPRVPAAGAIPSAPEGMPDQLAYDDAKQRLIVGTGCIEPVPPQVWRYEVSGKQVLVQWFSYRRKHRERPLIGDRRKASPLGDIQPDHWLAEYATELLNVLNVLGLLVELEPQAADLLARICAGPLLTQQALEASGAFFPEGHSPARAAPQGALPGFGAEAAN